MAPRSAPAPQNVCKHYVSIADDVNFEAEILTIIRGNSKNETSGHGELKRIRDVKHRDTANAAGSEHVVQDHGKNNMFQRRERN